MATTMKIPTTPLSIRCWCPGRTRRMPHWYWTICWRNMTRRCGRTLEVMLDHIDACEMGWTLGGVQGYWCCQRCWLLLVGSGAVHGAEAGDTATLNGGCFLLSSFKAVKGLYSVSQLVSLKLQVKIHTHIFYVCTIPTTGNILHVMSIILYTFPKNAGRHIWYFWTHCYVY